MSLVDLVRRFESVGVLVVGDVILDEYLIGTATRMSREAPIPVLELAERRCIAGGAANPAANAAALGASAIQASVIGADPAGEQLRAALRRTGADDRGLVVTTRPTPVKTRILAQMGLRFPQQVARIDSLPPPTLPPDARSALTAQVHALAGEVGAILFSDYRGGVLTGEWVQALRAAHPRHLLTADTQGNLAFYAGFDLVKCNVDELRAVIGFIPDGEAAYEAALSQLAADLQVGAVVVTRGAEGASLYSGGQYERVEAQYVRDVFDTVGAGDTFIAVATLARLVGADWREAVMMANAASGIVIQHVGNYTPSPAELIAALA
jgi:rfaE bifunctional protein kinase chain/domain